MSRRLKHKWKVLLVLSILLFFNIGMLLNPALAAEEEDTWLIPKGSSNVYQSTTKTDGAKIVQIGTHNKGTSSIQYRTTDYVMSLGTYDINNSFSLTNTAKFHVNAKDEVLGSVVRTTYSMQKSDFLDAMKKLGVTSKTIRDNGGSVTVYLHNVFELYNPNREVAPVYSGYSNIIGYQELLSKTRKLIGMDAGASPVFNRDTDEILKYYYNYPYIVKPTLFNVEVCAVDLKGKVLKTLKSGDSGMFNEGYPAGGAYTAPDTIVKDGITYKATSKWCMIYTSRTSRSEVSDKDNSGTTLSNVPLPDAKKDSVVKLCFKYEPCQAKIAVHAVDIEGNYIKKNMLTDTISPGEGFDRTVDQYIFYNGKNYEKTVDYAYTYTDTNGSSHTKKSQTTNKFDNIKFTIPTELKYDTTINVKVYYTPTDNKVIPVTVNAVNKTTGKFIKQLTTGFVAGGGRYEWDVSSPITSDTKSYEYTGGFNWFYTAASNSAKVTNQGAGMRISFTAPSSSKVKEGITVEALFNEANPNGVTLRVIMVNNSGGLISELSRESVNLGKSISKMAADPKSVNKVSYQYLNKWDYDYTTDKGNTLKSGTGKTVSFTVPNNTVKGSTVTIKFYYQATANVEMPEAADPITLGIDTPTPYGVINGDKYTASYFTSEEGISTTESQYVYIKTKDYLLGYKLVNKTGKMVFHVPVTMTYTISYFTKTPKGKNEGPKEITDKVEDTKVIPVERAFSYWEIVSLEYYYANLGKVYNYSLPDGGVTLTGNNSYLNIPTLSTSHSSSVTSHVMAPDEVANGIKLVSSRTFSSTGSDRPEIEREDLTSYALTMTGQAKVKNDSIIFGGSVVLSDSITTKLAPSPNVSNFVQCSGNCADKSLFIQNQIIDAIKNNGIFSSTGNVTYQLHPASINTSGSSRTYTVPVNSVTVHTPVICQPVISCDNKKWTQLISPETDRVQIVLDQDTSLNDFELKISNTLKHSNRLGYYSRDFSRSYIDPNNVSYIEKKNGIVRNEVKFPFDVYIDTLADGLAGNDTYLKAGTWFILGRDTYRFYVPMWVEEGRYTADFRTIAVNCTDKLLNTEKTRNSELNNYVATNTLDFEVSGRIYGLTVYDISDYPKWENVFRKEKTMLFKLFEGATDGTVKDSFNKAYSYYYTVGQKDQYGKDTGRKSRFTLPLINGSHPQHNNLGVLKTGYAFRFLLDTTGEMYSSGCHIKITPTFYHVDASGKNRKRVDLYYDEEINGQIFRIVKVGDGVDLVNIKSADTGNIYSRIPEAELMNTAKVMGTSYAKVARQTSTIYSYSRIKLLNAFRTFIGKAYESHISELPSYSDMQKGTSLTKTALSKFTQRWYGMYKIPTKVHAVASGYDVRGYLKDHGIDYKESFWLNDGYIIVNFNIVTVDKKGKECLSYINGNNYLNNGNCSMWVTEGAIVAKTDNQGTNFNFKAGDMLLYYINKFYTNDFEGGLY